MEINAVNVMPAKAMLILEDCMLKNGKSLEFKDFHCFSSNSDLV